MNDTLQTAWQAGELEIEAKFMVFLELQIGAMFIISGDNLRETAMRVAIRSPAARATEIQLGLKHMYFRLKTSSQKLTLETDRNTSRKEKGILLKLFLLLKLCMCKKSTVP